MTQVNFDEKRLSGRASRERLDGRDGFTLWKVQIGCYKLKNLQPETSNLKQPYV